MNFNPQKRLLADRVEERGCQALTLIEVAVILVILAVLALLFLPSLDRAKRKSQRITCANNLKQIGIATRLFATDSGDRVPMSVRTNLDSEVALFPGTVGPSNWVRDPRHFYQAAAHELATPSVVLCPADPRAALETTGSASMVPPRPLSVPWEKSSYFVRADAGESRPPVLLAGDRNLTLDGQPVSPGWVLFSSKHALGWTDEMHRRMGNVLLSDGSVAGLTGMVHTSVEPNRVLVP